MIVPHIGSIKKNEFDWPKVLNSEKESRFKLYRYKTHLGILGVLRLVADLKASSESSLQLVAITEFGEEMKHVRHYLAEEMNSCSKLNSGTKYVAADIGLKIKYPYNDQELMIRIDTRDSKTGKERYVKPLNLEEKLDKFTGRITYVRKTPKSVSSS